jgi:hypothetical protein
VYAGRAVTEVSQLPEAGFRDVTALDVAEEVLTASRQRLGAADRVDWVVTDLLTWRPQRRYRLWHDRAVFHFLPEPADRDRYRQVLHRALAPGGHVMLGAFADDGSARCSGLPTARYSPAELAAPFPDFELVEARREEHRTPWGAVQPFSWVSARRPRGCLEEFR